MKIYSLKLDSFIISKIKHLQNFIHMKSYIFILTLLIIPLFVNAQSDDEEEELIYTIFGMDKKGAVEQFVEPSETQKVAFWKLYDEYEILRKDIAKQRVQLQKQYAVQNKKMTNEQADAWTMQVMKIQGKNENLINLYYSKIKAATDAIVSTQFYQIENYLLADLRAQIYDKLPFVHK